MKDQVKGIRFLSVSCQDFTSNLSLLTTSETKEGSALVKNGTEATSDLQLWLTTSCKQKSSYIYIYIMCMYTQKKKIL